jgi:pimeloyl-ACP methyl ester carboxylesterase
LKGVVEMPETVGLSEAKRALLEKYLQGDISPVETQTKATRTRESSEPVSDRHLKVPVVPIQTNGTKRPFFYLHIHVVGGAFYNFALAHYIGADQPFYMLDPYMFDNEHMPPPLEEMAAEYITSLRTVQPEGPYLLEGFCGGGIIAFEMAQQLRDQGQEVDLLVLIEPRDGPAPHRLLFRRRFGGFIRRFGSLIGLSPEKQLELFLRIRYMGLNLVQSSYRIEKKFRLFPGIEFLRTDWIGIFVWILSQYKTRQYPGKVTYFWAREEAERIRAWRGKIAEAKELEVHLIPGTHDTCRTEHLHDMAEHLKFCLSKVQAAEPT